jgi:hypothetical protein
MKINEFSKLQEKQNYKHIALYDKFDKCRVRFNGQKNSSADKLKVIENRLESEIYNDDYYIIKCKNYHTDKETDDFIIHLKENIEMPVEIPTRSETPDHTINGYSFKKSLELEVEIKKLELDNNSYKKEILELKKEIEELEHALSECDENDLLNEEPKTDWKVFLSESLTTLAPLLDKHFELKERNIAIKEHQIKSFKPQMPKTVENDKVNNKFNEKLMDQLNTGLVHSINTIEDEDDKKQIMEIYNNSTDLNDCIKDIYEIKPELIETLMSQINE